MAEEKTEFDVIAERAKAMNQDSEATRMSRERLQSAKARKDKSFLDSLTDTESLISGGRSVAALLGGSPGAAAAIMGLDVLGSPKEMEQSKAANDMAELNAENSLQDQLRKDFTEKAREIDQNISVYQQNPQAYMNAILLGGGTNKDIARSLGMPEELTPDFAKMMQKSEMEVAQGKLAGIIYEEAGKADSPQQKTQLYMRAIGLQMPELKYDDRKLLAEAVATGSADFESLIPPGLYTGASLIEAKKRFFENPGDFEYITNALDPVMSSNEFTQKMDEDMLSGSIAITQAMQEMYELGEWPDVVKAIASIEDPELHALAQRYAVSNGFAGTARDNVEYGNKLFNDIAEQARRENMASAASGMGEPYGPEWVMNEFNLQMHNYIMRNKDQGYYEGIAVNDRVMGTISTVYGVDPYSALGDQFLQEVTTAAVEALNETNPGWTYGELQLEIKRQMESNISANRDRLQELTATGNFSAVVPSDAGSVIYSEPSSPTNPSGLIGGAEFTEEAAKGRAPKEDTPKGDTFVPRPEYQ